MFEPPLLCEVDAVLNLSIQSKWIVCHTHTLEWHESKQGDGC